MCRDCGDMKHKAGEEKMEHHKEKMKKDNKGMKMMHHKKEAIKKMLEKHKK